MMVKNSDLMTATEAAKKLNVSRWQVSYLCRRAVFPGAIKLPGIKGPWLVPAKDLPRYEAWCATKAGKQGRPPWHKPKRRR